MKKQNKKFLALCASAVCALSFSQLASAANVVLNNVDPPGLGLNDPTPAAPVGGNNGATVGEQRLNVFQAAVNKWGATLVSDVTIVVQASFSPRPCSATSGVLASAGPLQIFSVPDGAFPNVLGDTWYHVALINSLIGFDATPGPFDPGPVAAPFNDDIVAFFNSQLGTPGCLENSAWYYGLDNNQGPGEIDFLSVVLHEIGHGLGFSEFASEADGSLFFGLPSIYARYMLDTAQGKIFADMTDAERLQAQVAGPDLVWVGPSVTAGAPFALGPSPSIRILNPKSLKGTLEVQQASFGPSLRVNGGMTGQVKLVDDGTGVGTDACEPIQNNLNGKIALIDRGGCAFTSKVLNAQAAGAKGAIVANNSPGGPAPMGGFSPFVTIPSVGITLDQGNAIKAAKKVNLKLILDPDNLAGANADGFVQLYAPTPVQPGSSKSHFDTSATPNLLMEPSITPDLESATDLDLTPALFEDIGWVLQ
ncbi:MAG: PA domain-containing protein [Woeseia sp.]